MLLLAQRSCLTALLVYLDRQNRGSMGSMNNDLLYSKIEYLSLAPST